MIKQKLISIIALLAVSVSVMALEDGEKKPAVWIYTDMTNPEMPGNNHMGTINDPDDVSAMAAYLFMANMFDTRGIVVGSTHRKEHASTPDQAQWANAFFGKAYQEEVGNLNTYIGGFPEQIVFMQSCIKESAERFDPDKKYTSIDDYSTVKELFVEAENSSDTINVLCWGSLTEPAILVSYALENGRCDVLKKLRFIAHWTNSSWHQGSPQQPEDVANCREDANACAFLKNMASEGHIKYYECGAIGQHGIVTGSPKGEAYWDQFKVSKLGKIFAEGKYVHNSVDDSDCATYWVLLEKWGVGMDDIASDGSNDPLVEKSNCEKFKAKAPAIRNELLERAMTAARRK